MDFGAICLWDNKLKWGTGKMKERNEQKIHDESVSFDLCKKDYVQIITTAIVL